jgi:intracellular sulfur oxidation DsrE/DsrF family protein
MARFINLLGADGVKAARGDLIAIVHGPATPLVMDNAAYRAKFGVDNPNLELIALLRQSGADIHVCSQALAGNKIARENVNSGVQVDVSAMTTLANLQLRGFALIPD